MGKGLELTLHKRCRIAMNGNHPSDSGAREGRNTHLHLKSL